MDSVAVIVTSCKRFEQVWEPFCLLFQKYWPDCPFKIYFVTDFGKPNFNFLTSIELNRDLKFSSNLIFGLNCIEEKFIIYFQEDYLFLDYFNTAKILEFLKIIENNDDIGCIRLAPCPGPSLASSYSPELGVLQKGEEYRVSAQTAIWRKKTLLSLLRDGETGWNFEVYGTYRSNYINDIFLSVWRGQSPTPYFITAVTKGKWEDGAIELLKKENISLDKISKIIK